jgi:hypothetical protein
MTILRWRSYLHTGATGNKEEYGDNHDDMVTAANGKDEPRGDIPKTSSLQLVDGTTTCPSMIPATNILPATISPPPTTATAATTSPDATRSASTRSSGSSNTSSQPSEPTTPATANASSDDPNPIL